MNGIQIGKNYNINNIHTDNYLINNTISKKIAGLQQNLMGIEAHLFNSHKSNNNSYFFVESIKTRNDQCSLALENLDYIDNMIISSNDTAHGSKINIQEMAQLQTLKLRYGIMVIELSDTDWDSFLHAGEIHAEHNDFIDSGSCILLLDEQNDAKIGQNERNSSLNDLLFRFSQQLACSYVQPPQIAGKNTFHALCNKKISPELAIPITNVQHALSFCNDSLKNHSNQSKIDLQQKEEFLKKLISLTNLYDSYQKVISVKENDYELLFNAKELYLPEKIGELFHLR